MYYCRYCLHRFSGPNGENNRDEHVVECSIYGPQKIAMPTKDPILEFKNFGWRQSVSLYFWFLIYNTDLLKFILLPQNKFVIFADFETILPKVSTCLPDTSLSSTTTLASHISCGFSYVVINPDGTPSKPVTYRGMDATEKFLDHLLVVQEELMTKIRENVPIALSSVEEAAFITAQTCYVCNKVFTQVDHKVRDHDHTNGNFRGTAHNSCNLKLKPPKFIPVFLHNLSG